jgi:hypothetical protein
MGTTSSTLKQQSDPPLRKPALPVKGPQLETYANTTYTAEPMMPFFAAGLIVAYCVNAGANAMMQCTYR